MQGDEAAQPIPDNLKTDISGSVVKYQSLPQSIEFFLEEFPNGFYGEKFMQHERDYKEKAHDLAQGLLGQNEYSSLLDKVDYAEIAKRALRIVNATNLIYPNEKMALKDGLKSPDAQRDFANILIHAVIWPQ